MITAIRNGCAFIINGMLYVLNFFLEAFGLDKVEYLHYIDDDIKIINDNKDYYVRYRKSKWQKNDWEVEVVGGSKQVRKTIKKLLKQDLYTSIFISDSEDDEFEDDWYYRSMFSLNKKRKLIKKFDNEFSKEYVKKHKNCAGAMPDIEEVYRRYYQQKDIIKERDTKIKNQAEVIRNLEKKVRQLEKKLDKNNIL